MLGVPAKDIRVRDRASGTTPTKSLITHVSWALFTPDIPASFDFPDHGGPNSKALIGPRSSMNMAAVDIPIGVFQAVEAGHIVCIFGVGPITTTYFKIPRDIERNSVLKFQSLAA